MNTVSVIDSPGISLIRESQYELTKHTTFQKRRHYIHLVLMIILLSSIFPFLARSEYRGNVSIHGTMEILSSMLGLAIGYFLIARFLNFSNRFHLFVGLAYLMNGVVDFFHAMLSLGIMAWFGVTSTVDNTPVTATFITGRILLGIILLIAIVATFVWKGKSKYPKLEATWISVCAISLAIILTGVITRLPVRLLFYPDQFIPRPLDLSASFILLAALYGFIRYYMQESDMLTWWISTSITANVISEIFISFSAAQFDSFHTVAHVYKLLGYIIPLVGYSLYESGSITESRLVQEFLEKSKDELEKKVAERTVELKQANEAISDELIERKKAEEKVSRIAAELSQFIRTANAPIFGVDTSGRIMEWNQTAERITGYNKDYVLGKDLIVEFISEDYKAQVKEVLDRALKGDETASFEFPLLTRRGKRVMILLNASSHRDAEGKIIGVMGVGQDITELNEYQGKLETLVEERTRELNSSLVEYAMQRDRIDGILKSVADGLIVTDTLNRVILMNRAAEDLLGIRFSEIIDRPIDFAIEEETLREKVKDTLNKKVTGYEFDFEFSGIDPEHPRTMRARTSVIRDKTSKISGIVTIMHDVTHEREIDRLKTEFLSTAAHELRTPLTSIQGFSELVLTRKDLKEDEKNKFMTYINKQAVHLANIVNDLLNISRIESQKGYTINKIPCNIGEDIKKVVPYFHGITTKHRFEVTLPDKPIELFVDKGKIEQVLKNLLSNAVKYSPRGGTIRVVGEVTDYYYQVSVEDQGIGMTPEQVSKIFEKFFRADTSENSPEGTGLGMSIVKYLVEAHGGKVFVESEYKKGTKVTFTLPFEQITKSNTITSNEITEI